MPLIRKSSFKKLLIKIGSLTKVMLLGKPCSFHIIEANNLATLIVEKFVGSIPK